MRNHNILSIKSYLRAVSFIGFLAFSSVSCAEQPIEQISISDLKEMGCDQPNQSKYLITGNVTSSEHTSTTELKPVYDILSGETELALVEQHTYDMVLEDPLDEDSAIRVIHFDDGGFLTAFPGFIKPSSATDYENIQISLKVTPEKVVGQCLYKSDQDFSFHFLGGESSIDK